MKTSEVFQHAKKFLASTYGQIDMSEKEQFICRALATAHRYQLISGRAEYRAKDIIQARLNIGKVRCSTLEVWLDVNHGIKILGWKASLLAEHRYTNKMQATRHAWVDSMIAEFAAKGD